MIIHIIAFKYFSWGSSAAGRLVNAVSRGPAAAHYFGRLGILEFRGADLRLLFVPA
jgi:hypothetical protein